MADTDKTDPSWKWAIAIAFIGVLLIGLAGFMSTRERLGAAETMSCAPASEAAGLETSRPTIIAVDTGTNGDRPLLKLGKPVCVTVANLRANSPATLDSGIAAGEAEIRSTAISIAQTRKELASLTGEARKPAEQKIKDLQLLLEGQKAELADLREARAAAAADIDLALFLNGRETPARAAAEATHSSQAIRFDLEPVADAKSDQAVGWRSALSGIPSGGKRAVVVGVGLPGSARPLATWAPPVAGAGAELKVFSPGAAWAAGLGFILLLAAIFIAGRRSTLLRDGNEANSSYSLGRVQMAFWLVASAFGFVFIWVLSGQYLNVVSTATFTLLGISGATAFAAKAIDQNAEATTSRGFVLDILSDGNGGPKLHRVQVAVWTLILGAIFVWNILDRLILTDFDPNLLILLGISNGVYAGLKTQEG